MKLSTTIKVLLALGAIILSLYHFAPGFVQDSVNRVQPLTYSTISPAAQVLHDRLIVADLHADSLLWKRDLLKRSDVGHVDFPRLREGGSGLQVLSAVTQSPSGLNYEHNDVDGLDTITLLAVAQGWPRKTWGSLLERALYQAEKLQGFIARSEGDVMLLTSQADFTNWQQQRKNGREVIATVLATEGSHALEGKIENIDRLYAAGFRMMSLQHFFDNRLGGSLHGLEKKGLTDFGREVVGMIVDKGIMLDLAHSSEQTVMDVLAMTTAPVLVSHTGFRGHCDSPRNISDELMVAIAERGGIIGVGYWEAAVCGVSPADIAAAIVYGIGLTGEDHVALGSDFDGGVGTGFDSSQLVLITQALLDAGIDETVIDKVMGGNALRFIAAGLPAS